MNSYLKRPSRGSTLNGTRPLHFEYWRIGDGSRETFPLEMWIERAGEYHCKPNHQYAVGSFHVHSWTRFYYQMEGKAEVSFSDRQVTILPGDLLIVPFGFSHTYFTKKGTKYHWFALTGRWPSAIDESPSIKHFSLGLDGEVTTLFTAIREIIIWQKPGYPLKALGAFYELLGRLEEIQNTAVAQSSHPDPVRNALTYLEENCIRPFSATETASFVNLSQSRLRALFDQWVGESPKRYHTRCRIEQAKRLLCRQNLSVSHTAFEVGYNDMRYFSQVFKQYTGVTPSQYVKLEQ